MTEKSRIVGWVEQRETQHQSKEAKLKISGYSSLLLLPSSNQYLYFQNPRRIATPAMILLGYAPR